MTYENNRKYMAEAWIDNGKDEEFKKSFLANLIKQYQGHGNGFDADTVDGLHADDIMDLISDATEGFIESFQIGNTLIDNRLNKFQYFLGFEGIKLYNIESDGIRDEQKTLPWSDVLYSEEEDIPDLYDVINELYKLTYIGEKGKHSPTNTEIYNNFYREFLETKASLDGMLNALDGKITPDGKLNADMVNGFKFFIKTPEEYQEAEARAKIYEENPDSEDETIQEYKKDYDLINDVHNIIIIKTKEELAKAGYPDYPNGIENPDTAVISQFYQFRVEYADGDKGYGKYLQYCYEKTTDWKNMCLASDLLDMDVVKEKIKEILEQDTNYILNASSLRKSLGQITVTDDDKDIPLVNYNRDKFIYGGVYNFENENSKTFITKRKIGDFQYLDLSKINNDLVSAINTVQNKLDAYKTRLEGDDKNTPVTSGSVIGNIKGQITDIYSKLTSITGGSSKSIQDLDSVISTLDSRVQSLEATLGEYEDWKTVQIWQQSDGALNEKGGILTNGSLTVNEKLRLAVLNFPYIYVYVDSTTWKRVCYQTKNKTEDKKYHRWLPRFSAENRKYLPPYGLYFVSSNPNVNIKLLGTNEEDPNDIGAIMYRMYHLKLADSNYKDKAKQKYYQFAFKGIYHY